jgi:hypothetical protein
MKTSQNTLRIFFIWLPRSEMRGRQREKRASRWLLLIQKSYEFTCLIIAIFGKDCQVFFSIFGYHFPIFFGNKKLRDAMPGERNDSFSCRFQFVLIIVLFGSSRKFGREAAWGRVCGRAKLGAGTLRCLRLC